MKFAIVAGLLFGALHGSVASAEAHNKNRIKFSCDNDGCRVVTVTQGHSHWNRTKIRFDGDVCVYKPWTNTTICRY